ncbi:MAG: MYXO-CTERM sorting domain-containing protein [Myxococcota bacterium]
MVLAALASLVVLPRHAGADSRTDGVEHIFGATNVHAVTGHGRMSVGVSAEGVLTVLSWPNPAYADQILYGTSNAVDARTRDWAAEGRAELGAYEGAGVFFGLLIDQGLPTEEVIWLRDTARFQTTQDYGADDGANVRTVHTSTDVGVNLGLTVTVVDAVRPPIEGDPSDALVRKVTVEKGAGSVVTTAHLLSYANLSPVPHTSRVPKLPVVDWAYDGRNDFAAVWDADAEAIVHFHPEDQRVFTGLGDLLTPPDVDFGTIGEAMQGGAAPDVQTIADNLDDSYAPGAYLAMTTDPAPDQHQVGFDTTPMCDLADEFVDNVASLPDIFPDLSLPIPAEVADLLLCDRDALDAQLADLDRPLDAYTDVGDGALSGNDMAAGEVNEALRTPLDLSSGSDTVSLVLTAGPTAGDARRALDDVKTAGVQSSVIDAAETTLQDWLADRRLPEEAPADVIQVARRSLINVRGGTVADGSAGDGTVVASISRQPPYGLDWPRDGAFFNVLLDASGQSDIVAQRSVLYDEWQRKTPDVPEPLLLEEAPPMTNGLGGSTFPAGGWEMNYYPDGMTGGVFRFEIDNAGFAVWTLVAHAGWEDDPVSYLRRHWDAIVLGADFLAQWKDDATGLQAPAQEDDNPGFVQTIHGAVTTYGALDIAARGARLIGEDEDAARWERRAGELRTAILDLLWDEEQERFIRDPGMFGQEANPTGQTAWLVWPMTLLPFDDPKIEATIRDDIAQVTPRINLETGGGAYFMKNTVSANVAQLGLSASARDELLPQFEDLTAKLADHATPATHHFGEVMVVVDDDGTPRADQRTANPHLWEGTLFYLTALALEDPAALTKYDEVLPPSRVTAPGAGGDDGCGCHVAGARSSGSSAGAILLLGLVAVVFHRRRR